MKINLPLESEDVRWFGDGHTGCGSFKKQDLCA